MKISDIDKIDLVSNKFYSLNSAIEYYINEAPTKQKSQSIEPQGGCKPSYSEFDANHPHRVWATLAQRFHLAYKELTSIEQYAYRHLFYMYPANWGLQDVCNYHLVSFRNLVRAQKFVKEFLEDHLIDCGLMPMPDRWEPASREWKC